MAILNTKEFKFIEDFGLVIEIQGGSRTLGRIFGYLLLSDKPKTLDEIAEDLLFSKATASLTIRQGLVAKWFEKVSIPGERKTFYRANMESWINATKEGMEAIDEMIKLADYGLSIVTPKNKTALENLLSMKDFFEFILWYMADIDEQYERWKNGEIGKKKPVKK
ncbi:MAG: GbsR/MarR family transcriptional regulator [Candidatus Saccharibacteria bacterium]